MSLTMNQWLKGLLAAVINGFASSVVLVVVAPDKFKFADLQGLLPVAAAFGLLAMANYLKEKPLP